jgi:hydrogenase maturation protease
MAAPRVRVLACGNPEAGDDAAGLLAARAARSELPGVEVIELGPALRVLDLLEGVDAVVVVDAVRSGDVPGTIIAFDVGSDGFPARYRSALSSHGFGLPETIGLAGSLGPLPRIAFVGVEVGTLVAGPPGPEVERALPEMARRVVQTVHRLAEG